MQPSDDGTTGGRGPARPGVLGFVGIHAGSRAQARSQSETLAALFRQEGNDVRAAGDAGNPIVRALHHVAALAAWRDVDVVVVDVFSGRSFTMADYGSLLGRRLWGRKVVLFLHGGNLPEYGPAHRARVERVLRRADQILAPSDYLADVFRSWGFDVRVIPNVLEIEGYAYEPRQQARPALMWMRTFQDDYDPLLAVEVLHRVAAVHPEATLTMGGADHGLLDATRARAAELGVAERVSFAGFLDGAGKARAFADHDVFLNTNRVDNMPVSVLEAAACGLVPVATAVGGIPALLTDGVDSRVVPAADAGAMAGAVLELLREPAAFGRLSAAA
ncbi:MAG TPA: glycosyltransferase family 4 protein, partial [Acidimicrobiales bacterium]|nr:glycosyltransferase family 4 protein [Acidimicrobiales bacterium]